MRIVKRVYSAQCGIYRGTCNLCGCEVECHPQELRVREDKTGNPRNTVKCPEQGCENDFLTVYQHTPRQSGN